MAAAAAAAAAAASTSKPNDTYPNVESICRATKSVIRPLQAVYQE
jgi:hypothetical protein